MNEPRQHTLKLALFLGSALPLWAAEAPTSSSEELAPLPVQSPADLGGSAPVVAAPLRLQAEETRLRCEGDLEPRRFEIESLARKFYAEKPKPIRKGGIRVPSPTEQSLREHLRTLDGVSCFQGAADLRRLCPALNGHRVAMAPTEDTLRFAATAEMNDVVLSRPLTALRHYWKISRLGEAVGLVIDEDGDGYLDSVRLDAKTMPAMDRDLPLFAGGGGGTYPSGVSLLIKQQLFKSIVVDQANAGDLCRGTGLDPIALLERIWAIADRDLEAQTPAEPLGRGARPEPTLDLTDVPFNVATDANASDPSLRLMLWKSFLETRPKRAVGSARAKPDPTGTKPPAPSAAAPGVATPKPNPALILRSRAEPTDSKRATFYSTPLNAPRPAAAPR